MQLFRISFYHPSYIQYCAIGRISPSSIPMFTSISINRSLVEACNEGDIRKVRKLLDEGHVSVHDTTEEGESLLSLACNAGYYELAQVRMIIFAGFLFCMVLC